MLSRLRFILALGAFFVSAAAVSACGGDGVPGNAVARVGDQSIKKTTFDHWMRIAAVSAAGQQNPNATAAPKANIPDAPDFKQCIATKKKTAKPAKGQPEPTEASLKAQCKQDYEGLKTQVLDFLIRSTWLDNEASSRNVKVADKDVNKQIDNAKKQSFPKPQDFQKFLVRSGLTEADVFYQQRGQLLEQKVTKSVTKGKDKVSDAQVQAYYEKNKQRFAQPEKRDLRMVLTKTESKARQARAALDSGQSFKAVAKRFSIDQASKTQGGKLPGVSKGQQEKALDAAIFKARKGRLVGPVKTQFGFYVFEVTKVTPSKQQSLAQSKASIVQILKGQNQQQALKKFGAEYRKRWKGRTDCRKGYVTQDCKNAPKQKSTATTAAPAQPQTQTSP